MDNKTLKILLEKYYRGETALGEEQMLRHYFSGKEEIAPELEADRMLIRLTEMGKDERADRTEIEGKLSNFLDRNLAERSLFKSGRSLYRYVAAAVIVLLAGIASFILLRDPGRTIRDTYSDPQQAYHEVENTLTYVSEKINSGMAPLSHVDKIRKGTEPLKALDEIEQSLGMVGFISLVNLSPSRQNNNTR